MAIIGANGAVDDVTSAQEFDDYRNMLEQLGIERMRPGADGNAASTYDEAAAGRYLDTLPKLMVMEDGTPVKSVSDWRKRRAEILEDFEREIYGRIPAGVPSVEWVVESEAKGMVDGIETVSRKLVGKVDNSTYPSVEVNISVDFTVPAEADGAVPVMVYFGGFGPPRGENPWTSQAIKKGWAHATINPWSFQPDNNSFRTGIIGLMAKGQPRKPDEWGALRAWAWGVSRLVDYFEANPSVRVDAKKVGIAGLSRYGKAAIVTQAFDERIAVGLIGSSGQGGTKLHRHEFGERVENLTGGLYYWMAGNYIKYGAAEPEMTPADLPVDSHQLIALCAPRPTFISHGVPEKGDALWIDAQGSYMAGILASPAFELYGKKGFGVKEDYRTANMPPVETLIGGELAWRQHTGGHDITPNWPSFFEWVEQYIEAPGINRTVEKSVIMGNRANTPTERTDALSRAAHADLLKKVRRGKIDVYFVGDSIARRWGTSDEAYKHLYAHWKESFWGWNAANFAWGGDSTQNILWRMDNGELGDLKPKVFVVQAGTNNLNQGHTDEEIVSGVAAIVERCKKASPEATVVLTGVFLRSDNSAYRSRIGAINAELSAIDGVRFLDVNDQLVDSSGEFREGMMGGDGLHPELGTYRLWADALKPILREVLGEPSEVDLAPPPTGVPDIDR